MDLSKFEEQRRTSISSRVVAEKLGIRVSGDAELFVELRKGESVLQPGGVETRLPWWRTEDWNPDEWYPLPVGFMARNQEDYIINGYMIFQLDPEGFPGDVSPVYQEEAVAPMTFEQALLICEAHNKRTMIL